MKIDRRNHEHLTALFISGTNSCIAAVARPFIRQKNTPNKIIIFYGHTLNGNLKAFYDYLLDVEGYNPYFLVLDKKYFKRIRSETTHPNTILNSLSLKDMLIVARADAFIASHGLHLFTPLIKLTNIKFIDVWHAVSYKGFSVEDFKFLRAYDEIWVSSEAMRQLYINRYKQNGKKVKITGYGRTDLLVGNNLNKNEIIHKYSIAKAKKYILIAPTWLQDTKGREIIPFGVDKKLFFSKLDKLAKKHSAHIIFRTHLNSGDAIHVHGLTNTSFMPYSKYEVVEDFLYLSDILVTDWSSIAIDFLPLKRPTIFLDVKAPFKAGFNLGPENRYGDIVSDFSHLLQSLEQNLKDPQSFQRRHNKAMKHTTKTAYGNTLDGESLRRYFVNLKRLVGDT